MILGHHRHRRNQLDVWETREFQDKNEGQIQKATEVDDEIQGIKRNLDAGKK